MEDHRFLLLEVSHQLTESETEELMYLCPSVKTEPIFVKKAIRLFTVLEKEHLIGPGEYSYLCKRLNWIGRVDLQVKLQTAVLCHVPNTFQDPSQQLGAMISSLQRLKVSCQRSADALLYKDGKIEVSAHVTSVYEGFGNSYAVDTTPLTNTFQFYCNFQEAIDNISSFAQAYYTHYLHCIVDPVNTSMTRLEAAHRCFMSSHSNFTTALHSSHMTPAVNQPTLNDWTKANPVASLTDDALTDVESVCKGFIGPQDLASEISITRTNNEIINSNSTGAYFATEMLRYLSKCVCLLHTKQIDIQIGHFQTTLERVVTEHRAQIERYYKLIIMLLGCTVDTLNKALPFDIPRPDLDTTDNKPLTLASLCEASLIPWCSLFIILLMHSKGLSLNGEECLVRIARYMYDQMTTDISVQVSTTVIKKMALGIHEQIENLKTRLSSNCTFNSPQLALIQNLLSI